MMPAHKTYVAVGMGFYFLIVFVGQEVRAGTNETASALYQRKQYNEALKIWYDEAESGKANAALYYNIGITESQLGMSWKASGSAAKSDQKSPAAKKAL
jgi:hypothetical protein